MTKVKHVIVGCGDVGRRIARQLVDNGASPASILGLVQSAESERQCLGLGIMVERLDLDQANSVLPQIENTHCYYLVPPQKSGEIDRRSRSVLDEVFDAQAKPAKVVLISTTGVYGDCAGAWVTEQTPPKPATERGKRRLDSEQQWSTWCQAHELDYLILRVPGIYARSRLPRARIEKGIPVVKSDACGFTNRIHADDLATVSIAAMQSSITREIYNVTDGSPGKISDYLQAAAKVLELPALPEISMREAQQVLSSGMLSYLSESRRISNQKMLQALNVKLRYPNFKEGLKFG